MFVGKFDKVHRSIRCSEGESSFQKHRNLSQNTSYHRIYREPSIRRTFFGQAEEASETTKNEKAFQRASQRDTFSSLRHALRQFGHYRSDRKRSYRLIYNADLRIFDVRIACLRGLRSEEVPGRNPIRCIILHSDHK